MSLFEKRKYHPARDAYLCTVRYLALLEEVDSGARTDGKKKENTHRQERCLFRGVTFELPLVSSEKKPRGSSSVKKLERLRPCVQVTGLVSTPEIFCSEIKFSRKKNTRVSLPWVRDHFVQVNADCL